MTQAQEPGPLPPRPRRGPGCVTGCLAVAVLALLAIGGWFGYGTWYLYRGFARDPALQTVMNEVRAAPLARAVLGRDIRLTAVERDSFSYATGRGKTASYRLKLLGARGEGELSATVDLDHGRKVTSMILTGPHGEAYTLVGQSPSALPDRSI